MPCCVKVFHVYFRVRWKTGSRSPGVGVPDSDVIKIWKTRSHMENTESDVIKIWKTRSLTSQKNIENTESYGKHGVPVKYGKHGV